MHQSMVLSLSQVVQNRLFMPLYLFVKRECHCAFHIANITRKEFVAILKQHLKTSVKMGLPNLQKFIFETGETEIKK